MGDGDAQPDADGTPAPASRKTKITYDNYMAILNLLVRRVNDDEQATGEGVEHEDLVVWYLEQKEEEIETEQQMNEERSLVEKVLRRMVKVRTSLSRTSCYEMERWLMRVIG